VALEEGDNKREAQRVKLGRQIAALEAVYLLREIRR
jgi:hypothetical protein